MIRIFQPKSNFAWAIATWLLVGLFAANSIMTQTEWTTVIGELMFGLIVSASAYLLWVRPKICFFEDRLIVVNPLTTITISYDDILELSTKWALRIRHKRGVTTVWVAPAGGKRRWIASETFKTYGSAVPLSGQSGNETEASSESMNSLSGQAAYTIREFAKRRH